MIWLGDSHVIHALYGMMQMMGSLQIAEHFVASIQEPAMV